VTPLGTLPATWRHRWQRWLRPAWFGTLRGTTPRSRQWGYDRGTPVDRYYIERFLDRYRQDIRGRVLEVKDGDYTARFGAGVEWSDVLDVATDNPAATIVADLAAADMIPAKSFDCCIVTQTLPLIYDVAAAVAHTHRILKPGGVLLATVPSMTPMITELDYWRFTVPSCQRLFEEVFGAQQIQVTAAGSVLSCVAFLHGLAAEELSQQELDTHDPRYPLVITIRATRRG
jgi:SAM-dependent methyltransferase